jgi:hypothetical protein
MVMSFFNFRVRQVVFTVSPSVRQPGRGNVVFSGARFIGGPISSCLLLLGRWRQATPPFRSCVYALHHLIHHLEAGIGGRVGALQACRGSGPNQAVAGGLNLVRLAGSPLT